MSLFGQLFQSNMLKNIDNACYKNELRYQPTFRGTTAFFFPSFIFCINYLIYMDDINTENKKLLDFVQVAVTVFMGNGAFHFDAYGSRGNTNQKVKKHVTKQVSM